MTPVLRFAPSPNGRLHLGHAYSALLNARLAERMQGRFLLRMEDIDSTRCTPELTRQCLEDLAWLGLRWEEPVRVQSQHRADYAASLGRLREQGLLYPCFCSRSDIALASRRTDPEGAPVYPGTCAQLDAKEVALRMDAGTPHGWRIHMARARALHSALSYGAFYPADGTERRISVHPERWGDVVLARKDIGTSYHMAVVTDDALQGVTHIVRGTDLEAATDIHVLLQSLLGLPTPLYHHHALLTDQEGAKLAKSRSSIALAELRTQGMTPEAVRQYMAAWGLQT